MLKPFFICTVLSTQLAVCGQPKNPTATSPTKRASFDYDKTRWDMKRDQVKVIYPDAIEIMIQAESIVQRTATIMNIPVNIRFIFEESGLAKVQITPVGDASNPKEGLRISALAASALKNGLEAKYGPATISSHESDKWLTPKTEIELTVLRQFGEAVAVFLVYSKRVVEPGL